MFLCASITHWLGSISKLPNQCENISIFFWPFWKLPNQCTELPNQCEMLAHPPCASISHWLGSFQIFGYFLAFFEKLPNQCEMLAQGGCASISHWLGKTGSFRNYTLIGQDFKTAQSMWKNFKNISAILKLPNQCMDTTQSMWNACSKHFTLIGINSPIFCDYIKSLFKTA